MAAGDEQVSGPGCSGRAAAIGCAIPALFNVGCAIPLLLAAVLFIATAFTFGTTGKVPGSTSVGQNTAASTQLPEALQPIFLNAANKHDISVHFLSAIYWMEHGKSFPVTPDNPDGSWACSKNDDGSPLACGPFQFIESSWKTFAEDCDGDGKIEPFPDIRSMADSACAATKHLQAAKGVYGISSEDLEKIWSAAFSYNHAGWYANAVRDKYKELVERS